MGRRQVGELLFLLLSLFSLSSFAQTPNANCSKAALFFKPDTLEITTFGASTVQGFSPTRNFQDPLKKHLQNCYSNKVVTVSNFGVAGESTFKGLLRIDNALAAAKGGFVMILMGSNDVPLIVNRQSTVEKTRDNMRIILQKCKDRKLYPILGTIQYFRDDNSKANQRANFIVNQINIAYKNLAKEMDVPVVDINALFGKNFQLYADYVHPNSRGYYVMSLAWFDALNNVIESKFLGNYVSQNYPNPSQNGSTRINYTVPSPGKLLISLYNMNGKFVRTLYDDYQNSGYYEKDLDLSALPSGIYIYIFQLGSYRKSQKIIIGN